MKDAKHTRGPWSLKFTKLHRRHTYDHGYRAKVLAADPVMFGIADILGPSNADMLETFKANACLMAATPDLLAALEYWFDSKATPKELAEMARAAIDKARGITGNTNSAERDYIKWMQAK